ncbi:P-loop containing nucleoside triphosphate hydrolase protein [Lineolata rhizophorae]|uniref:RNA helicase n=1 Tax=Lineolata rhizophorae TaxID=578093 RepID=A0A6A6P0X6_9PEZI|nr:P-loop containing nucleoside triphosphate hydrolase protein [Lineolata rhizophorae]
MGRKILDQEELHVANFDGTNDAFPKPKKVKTKSSAKDLDRTATTENNISLKKSNKRKHGHTEDGTADDDEQSKLDKAARKKARQEKREAKAARRTLKEENKAARKAAKKAEKARQKELQQQTAQSTPQGENKQKKVVQFSLDDSTDATTTNNSRSTSSQVSCITSASTSPEPTLPNQMSTSRYTEPSALKAYSESTVDAFLVENQIIITDPAANPDGLRPITEFKFLPTQDNKALQATFANFKSPTPIQAAAWPHLLSNRDVIGVAETGSGKTLAFGIPCVEHVRASLAEKPSKKAGAVRAVIVTPTRELAAQVDAQLNPIAAAAGGLRTVCVYGGVPKDPQVKAIQRGASIVVATPGRLNDLISDGSVHIGSATYLVLDEADRMLDKGFEDEVKRIINACASHGKGRQTAMFTATWPEGVRTLAASFLRMPVLITIGGALDGDGTGSGELRVNDRITQRVEVIDQRGKDARLVQILHQFGCGRKGAGKEDRILVFCLYKKEAARVETFLRRNGFNVGGIHGDLAQAKRTEALEAFRAGKTPVLVATDVAARGLDIPDVRAVVNVTFPLTVEDYVHRIGRTGRAGKTGEAITLFTEHDKAHSGALINVLKRAEQAVPEELLKFGTTVKKKGHDAYGAFYKDTGDAKKATKITFDD